MKSGRITSSRVCIAATAALMLACLHPAWAQAPLKPGDAFPLLEGKALSGKTVRLPEAALGKPVVVMATFSRDAGTKSSAWAKRFAADKLIAFQTPFLEKAPRLIRGFITRSMRSDAPPALHDYMVVVTAGEAEWRQRFGVERDDVPHLLVLDAQGRVTARHAGAFDENAYRSLAAALAPR